MTLRPGIVGLGQVAWRFDEEPNRGGVWTHAGAYHATGYAPVVGFDSDAAARAAFASRFPTATVVDSIEAFNRQKVDVVSIGTPNDKHAETLYAVLTAGPKAVWCEKPLATELKDARRMVAVCAERGIHLVVSHVRRWSPIWRRFKARIEDGEVGRLRSIRVAMPNRLWSIGSHAVDLLVWIGGPVAQLRWLDVPTLFERDEPARVALLAFASGAIGHLQVTGLRANLVVEAEAIGDGGRLTISELSSSIRLERFDASARYEGYCELRGGEIEQVEAPAGHSPFVAIAQEIRDLVTGVSSAPTCGGADALQVQEILARIGADDGASGGVAA